MVAQFSLLRGFSSSNVFVCLSRCVVFFQYIQTSLNITWHLMQLTCNAFSAQIQGYMDFPHCKCLLVICVLAFVLCGAYIKLNSQHFTAHYVVHTMFANKRLSQVDKHNAAKFQNVVKTNSRDQQKGFPPAQIKRKEERPLQTLFIAEDKLLQNLKHNCSYKDAWQGKDVFVVLQGGTINVTLSNYKKKQHKNSTVSFLNHLKGIPIFLSLKSTW